MRNTDDIEISRLKQQLNTYVDNAKENELKLRRFQQQELQFVAASGIEELLHAFFNDYPQRFQLDAVSLLLVDGDYEIRRILENLNINWKAYPSLLFIDDKEELHKLYGMRLKPQLGAQHSNGDIFFPRHDPKPLSIAALPLSRAPQLIGSFNIGSFKARRFSQRSATDFLERLVNIFAICFENAINNEKVKLLGLLDPLTGVHNRRYFDQRLTEEINRALREDKPLSCLFLDIDHFKSFNDNHGHQIGDLVLQDVAAQIKSQMRLSDVLARFGGEEFAVLLSHTGENKAMDIAERIRLCIDRHRIILEEEQTLHVTLSAGCSTLTQKDTTLNSEDISARLISAADEALYTSKQQGRNRVSYKTLNLGN